MTHARYPLFVDLRDRLVVVVGGGAVAERKLKAVLPYGANAMVVAPQVTRGIEQLEHEGRVRVERRTYRAGDLAGATIAFCACGDSEVEARVHEDARQTNCLLNVVDVPSECDFIVPSIVRRGLLSVAVSTSGASCAEARRIREQLEGEFDESWEPYLDLLAEVRAIAKERMPEGPRARRPVLEAAAQLGWRERIAAGESISAEDAFAEAVAAARNGRA